MRHQIHEFVGFFYWSNQRDIDKKISVFLAPTIINCTLHQRTSNYITCGVTKSICKDKSMEKQEGNPLKR